MRNISFFIATIAIFAFINANAEPLFKTHRFDDNVDAIAKESELAGKLKNIKIADQWDVDFGGDLRISREWFNHPDFGLARNQAQGYWASRYSFHSNIKGPGFTRLFFQLKYSDVEGKDGKPGRLDNDYGDVQQVFWDNRWFAEHGYALFSRLGRQEASIASGRFVSVRDTPNSRLTFDGLLFAWDMPDKDRIEGFVARPTLIEQGSFDNKPDQDNLFASLVWSSFYKTTDVVLDPYVMYFENLAATFVSKSGTEERYTWGLRLQTRGALSTDTDFAVQTGEFNNQEILAYGFASSMKAQTPVESLNGTLLATFFTGNGANGSNRLATFNSMYPKGTYYGYSAQIGHPNLMALQPGIEYILHSKLKFALDYGFYWRQSLSDVVYRGNGTAMTIPSANDDQRYIGSQLNFQTQWSVNAFVTAFFEYSHFFEGMDIAGLQDCEYLAARILWKF